METSKTIAVVKLNRGAWMEFREQLIARFNVEKCLDTYSDEFVRKTDGTTYVVKIIPVHPNFLDPLIGFEGACDAADMERFINKVQDQLRQYTTLRVNTDPSKPEIESTENPFLQNIDKEALDKSFKMPAGRIETLPVSALNAPQGPQSDVIGQHSQSAVQGQKGGK